MPVFVTLADTPVGVAVVAGLAAEGADVRAFAAGDGDVGALRDAGAIVAIGDHDDEGHLEAAMTHAHTVVVPDAGWLDDPGVVAATRPVVVRAAHQAGVARIVLVSLVGADPDAAHPLLAAHGRVERLAEAADPQSVVVRIDGVDRDAADVLAALEGCPRATVAPVATSDLAAGLVALDRARSARSGGHALFTALGSHREPGDRGGDLVGRRWMPPARRGSVRSALCDRGAPPVAGADLWQFVDRGDPS